jgi:hypothetical protein
MGVDEVAAKDLTAGVGNATQPLPRATASSDAATRDGRDQEDNNDSSHRGSSAADQAAREAAYRSDEKDAELAAALPAEKLLADPSASAERSLDEKRDGNAAVSALEQSTQAAENTKDDAREEIGEEEVGVQYLTGLPRLLLGFGLCVTTFLIGLDQVRCSLWRRIFMLTRFKDDNINGIVLQGIAIPDVC